MPSPAQSPPLIPPRYPLLLSSFQFNSLGQQIHTTRLVGPHLGEQGTLPWGDTHGGCGWASQPFSDQLCGSKGQKLTLHWFRRPEAVPPTWSQGWFHPPGGPEKIRFDFSSGGGGALAVLGLGDVPLQSSPPSCQLHRIEDHQTEEGLVFTHIFITRIK